MQPITTTYNSYTITTDKQMMDVNAIHKWLSEESYWCKDVPFEIVKKSFDHSFCIGVLCNEKQIGFARLITDYATFGYLADVYVEEVHRGKGISKKMLEILFDLDWVKGLRGIKLQTKGTQGLYRKFGFADCKYPERIMEISRPDVYLSREL